MHRPAGPPRARVGPSGGGAGLGLFATAPLRAGDAITLYPGRVVETDPGDDDEYTVELVGDDGRRAAPMQTVNAEEYAGPGRAAGEVAVYNPRRPPGTAPGALALGHFANHSLGCNAQIVQPYSTDDAWLGLCATRPIGPGDQIVIDYGTGYATGWCSPLQRALVAALRGPGDELPALVRAAAPGIAAGRWAGRPEFFYPTAAAAAPQRFTRRYAGPAVLVDVMGGLGAAGARAVGGALITVLPAGGGTVDFARERPNGPTDILLELPAAPPLRAFNDLVNA